MRQNGNIIEPLSDYREILFAQGGLEEARLLAINGQGYVPIDFIEQEADTDSSIRQIPLWRGKGAITRNYCMFWKKDNSGYYIEEFAGMSEKEI